MTDNQNPSPEVNSKVYTLYYAFFLIPLMITILGVMFFFMFKVLTYETNTPLDYLNDVQYGAATKRWQSAYELSKMLSESSSLETLNNGFHQRMIGVYEHSIHDDPLVRMYLALAMGRTGNEKYGEALMVGLNDEDIGCKLAAIKSLGYLSYEPAIEKIADFTKKDKSREERLEAVIALGNMNDMSVLLLLKNMLNDEEPNIRWDAAISLAKLGDRSGIDIIVKLLDREYFSNFTQVDEVETVNAILVAIQISSKIPSEKFVENLMKLAVLDKNMKIRDFALKTLDKTYNRKI